ncbi:heavy metal translocating P-type ATPase [Geopsychrobacter electrodiphilus]|uniref:heavy metal translocating P-type ATPase n=1 Tax=Geopsychrobacter electrodiphilus TaxID=225196 RepID=UPI000370FD63|nr:heavy metal translocating P-type ATPase [Geopsychrobacter electrodiphilus]
MSECASKSCGCSGAPVLTTETETETESRVVFRIDNMDCPTEEALIRDKLAQLPGVAALEFNLLQRTLTLTHNLPSADTLEDALAAIGMHAVRQTAASGRITLLHISGMDCPTEEGLIRRKLNGMEGVFALDFNLVQRKLTLDHSPEVLPQVLQALKSLDLEARVIDDADTGAELAEATKINWWPMAVSGCAAVSAEAVHWLNGGFHWTVAALALLAIVSGGLPTYKKGLIALRNLNLNMNALMSIAVTGAMLIGQWPEAAMVMFLFALAEIIEAKSLDRARNAIRSLMDLAPQSATLRQPDGSWVEVPAAEVPLEALVRVKPGERIALDGEIVSGSSTVNQAPITGESLPVEKTENDPVFAGTINESGSFEYRVTALANNTTLARIIHAVEAAQGSRAPTQRFVDKFARVYTPSVIVVALAMMLIPPLAFGAAWLDWIYRALVLLVVACPCALVISTPVTIVSGLAAAARKGILIKGGIYLEGGRKLAVLALDKTGTITHGKPEQTDFKKLGGGEQSVRRLAVSLASRSDHPVSQAISRAALEAAAVPVAVANFAALPGRGVRGTIDGQLYHLGNHRLISELGLTTVLLEEQLNTLECQGKTAVMLATEREVLGLFAVADTVKETSRLAIADLHALGIRTLMLTGDNSHTAEAIARQVGIDEACGNQLPEDKLKTVEALLEQGSMVGMVGDGINDAPALARADIGFAMGAAGTDTAIETADVALMDDDLRKLPTFVRLSRTTGAILTQNIAFALGVKLIFIALTFSGHATMWMAVFADMGASLLVVFNGLRLLRK